MQRLFQLLALLASTGAMIPIGSALAEEAGNLKVSITKESIEKCRLWGELAALSMDAHQEGRPLADQMQLTADARAQEITLAAYRKPRFQFEQMRKAASATYRDEIAAECMVSLSNPDGMDGVRPHIFWAINKPTSKEN